MNILNENWQPKFGTIYTWFAMDKNGKIAIMVNNCFGNLPRSLLLIENVELLLDLLIDYTWEESKNYVKYSRINGSKTVLDLYSNLRYNYLDTRKDVELDVLETAYNTEKIREYNIPALKGFFIYHGIEGSNPGQDYPVGYDGETKMGDYFRFLMPTTYGTIDCFPEELRHGIVVSDTIDFTVDRLLDNDKINEYFTRMYRP